jgi:diadenosine tetraphosphate (Ap4A) HIT family hydrolase
MSFNSSLPGWAVVLPDRHVETVTELTDEEAAALGPLLRNVSRGLTKLTGCVKTYVILLAEAEGFAHLHFHVVPRMADLAADRRGTAIFAYLKEEPLGNAQLDAFATRLRRALDDATPPTVRS